MTWREETVTQWKDLKEILSKLYDYGHVGNWVFRGQEDYSWALSTSLERIHIDINRRVAEEYLLYEFKGAAHHYIDFSGIPQNTLEWLALMQHHGAPTRLLDFTKSPFVGCYFALEKYPRDKKPAALWAINTDWLDTQALHNIRPNIVGYDRLRDYQIEDPRWVASEFDSIFVNHSILLVLPVEPIRMNERLVVQQGIFLCPGAIEKTFEENLLHYGESTGDMSKYVLKIKLENSVREEALYELHAMNINRASLFRGIDGFAKSLEHKLEIEHDRRQMDRIMKELA